MLCDGEKIARPDQIRSGLHPGHRTATRCGSGRARAELMIIIANNYNGNKESEGDGEWGELEPLSCPVCQNICNDSARVGACLSSVAIPLDRVQVRVRVSRRAAPALLLLLLLLSLNFLHNYVQNLFLFSAFFRLVSSCDGVANYRHEGL